MLGPFDNSFSLLGMRKKSIEAALLLENKDYEKAYRVASRILRFDKLKDQTDVKQKALVTEQYGKLSTARDMLLIPTSGPSEMIAQARERRRGYIRRATFVPKWIPYADVECDIQREDEVRQP